MKASQGVFESEPLHISGQLFNNTVYIIDINKFINDSWVKLVQTNQATTDKWKEDLQLFK